MKTAMTSRTMSKFSNGMAAAAMSLALGATGCIFTSGDGDQGGELDVSWSFINVDAPASCPAGDFTVVVYTWPVGASESAVEGVAYNCTEGGGYSAFVEGQVDVWIELLDASDALYARSKTERIDANNVGEVAFTTQLDYGFYQLNWGFFATTNNAMEDLTCAQVEDQFVDFSMVSLFATYLDANNASSLWEDGSYDCIVGEAPAVFYTEPMPFNVTELNVIGSDASDNAVGIGGCVNDPGSPFLGFAYGNEIKDVGLLMVSLDPEDAGNGGNCYDNERP